MVDLVNWDQVRHFKELQNRPDIKGVVPKLIYTIDDFREILGYSIYASPVIGAIVAQSGHAPKSYHYKGMAIDCFPDCDPLHTLFTLLNYNPFGGIGIYFDTIYNNKKKVMFHFDIRERKPNGQATWWFRDNHKYYYLGNFNNDTSMFLEAIVDRMKIFQKL